MRDRSLKVRNFRNETIFATNGHCSVYDTIRWLDEHRADHAVITEELDDTTVIVGIVTRESLASVLLTRSDYDDLALEQVMSDSPVIVGEDDDFDMAASWLTETRQRVAIVVNRAWEMVGTLSLADCGVRVNENILLAPAA